MPLKTDQQVLKSLKALDDYFFKPNDPNSPDRLEAAGHAEALMETFRREKSLCRSKTART